MKLTHLYIATFLSVIILTLTGCSENDNPIDQNSDLTLVAFIHQPATDYNNPLDFKTFLSSRGFITTLVEMDSLVTFNFTPYDLIIMDNKIGSGNDWGTVQQGNAVLNANKPVVGIGFGGARFFGEIGLTINYDNSWRSSDTSNTGMLNTNICIDDIHIDDSHVIFTTPSVIPKTDDTLIDIYSHSGIIAVNSDASLADSVTFFGRQPSNDTYYPIVQEGSRYFLWGFTNSPGSMTGAGKEFFWNVVNYMVP